MAFDSPRVNLIALESRFEKTCLISAGSQSATGSSPSTNSMSRPSQNGLSSSMVDTASSAMSTSDISISCLPARASLSSPSIVSSIRLTLLNMKSNDSRPASSSASLKSSSSM